ncbi:hypothetical protein BDP27DRAFT_998479 [Rhodocollybia butyracea]|uniref:Uncharacterized protein n=1 Tax=Rhodocollybia butyracea TaxID=206335 RepID=A0A9P5PJE7_9AGAR|nr:hypothetical protein BDP27DRAFT_998479 [Rhodocollybia butyracea]
MKAVLFASASAALIFGASAATLSINTPPSLTVCEPALLQWTGGTPPYASLVIFPDGTPTSTLLDLGPQGTNTQFTWNVNITSGSVGFTIVDSTGAMGQSAAVPIQPGTSTSCIGGNNTITAPSSPGTGSGSSSTSAGTGATTTGGNSSPSATSPGSTSGSSSGSAASSTNTSGASSQSAQFGVAAIVAAALGFLV